MTEKEISNKLVDILGTFAYEYGTDSQAYRELAGLQACLANCGEKEAYVETKVEEVPVANLDDKEESVETNSTFKNKKKNR